MTRARCLPAVLREMWERLALDQRHEREDRRHGLAAPHTQDHRAARFFAGAGLAGTLNESHRMMMRSLAYLDGRVRGGKAGTVTVDRARPSQHRECGRDRNVQERTAAPVRDNLILPGP